MENQNKVILAFVLSALPSLAAGGEFHCKGASGWADAVHERIHPRWASFLSDLQRAPPEPRYSNPALAVSYVLAVESDGRITGLEDENTTGLGGFDRAPLDILRELGELPPPPEDCRSDDGRVYLSVVFSRGKKACERREVVQRLLRTEEAIPQLVQWGREAEAASRIEAILSSDPPRARRLMTTLSRWFVRAESGSPQPERRALVATALSHVDDGEPMLLQLVSDPDPRVRHAALAALGERAGSIAARKQLEAALTPRDAAVAAHGLLRLADRGARPALRQALSMGISPAEVTEALVSLGDHVEAARITRQLLATSATPGAQPSLLEAGVAAARVLGDPTLGQVLMELLPTVPTALKPELVRAAAAPAHRVLPEVRALISRALLHKDPSVRAAAATAVAAAGDHSVGTQMRLVDLIIDADASVRGPAVAAIVEVGGANTADELFRPLRDPSPLVRTALGLSIAAHPFEGAGPYLRRLLSDGNSGVKAVVAHAVAISPAARAMMGKYAPPAEQALHDGGAEVATAPASGESQRAARLLHAASPAERLNAAGAWLATAGEAVPQVLQASNSRR